MTTENKILIVIDHTNTKLAGWYNNAKLDYNVDGFGKTTIEGNTITINYTEDGIEREWSMPFYFEYMNQDGLDYFYNVWMEEAFK